jgi:hypothetical protein
MQLRCEWEGERNYLSFGATPELILSTITLHGLERRQRCTAWNDDNAARRGMKTTLHGLERRQQVGGGSILPRRREHSCPLEPGSPVGVSGHRRSLSDSISPFQRQQVHRQGSCLHLSNSTGVVKPRKRFFFFSDPVIDESHEEMIRCTKCEWEC